MSWFTWENFKLGTAGMVDLAVKYSPVGFALSEAEELTGDPSFLPHFGAGTWAAQTAEEQGLTEAERTELEAMADAADLGGQVVDTAAVQTAQDPVPPWWALPWWVLAGVVVAVLAGLAYIVRAFK